MASTPFIKQHTLGAIEQIFHKYGLIVPPKPMLKGSSNPYGHLR